MKYGKPALTFERQRDLLTGRGLQVDDPARCLRWLKHHGYYRLSGYFVPFKAGTTDRFRGGATFDQIAGLYIFDRKLRLIVLDAIERIEISLRTALTYEIAHKYGPFGHTDPRNFAPGFKHTEFMNAVLEAERSSRETFLIHFRGKYTSERHLPLWMASELLSFGSISRLFKACHPDIKRSISRRFIVPDRVLINWFHVLSYVRNVCAHHSRLWNRELAITPMLPKPSAAWPYRVPRADRLYAVLVILRHCLLQTHPHCQWRSRLLALFDAHNAIDLAAMGMPSDWRAQPAWM